MIVIYSNDKNDKMRKMMKEKKLNVPNYFRVDPNDFYGKY